MGGREVGEREVRVGLESRRQSNKRFEWRSMGGAVLAVGHSGSEHTQAARARKSRTYCGVRYRLQQRIESIRAEMGQSSN